MTAAARPFPSPGPEVDHQEGPPPIPEGSDVAPGYTVLAHLSRAQVLDVYDVWSAARDCRCIAKTLRPDRRDDAAAQTRLVREGDMLVRLTHPHIVRGYEVLEPPHTVVILETLTGETLAHLIARSARRLGLADVCHLGLHVASAVGYLHRNGVLHLDLKPSNVIATDGMAKVIDLSLARPPGPVPRGLGTRQYMAPEQARGTEATPASDVWGVGAVLFAAATGHRPFEALPDGYDQLRRRATPVGTLRRVPRRLRAAIDACLEPRPEDRPALAELRGDLAACLDTGDT